LNFYRQAYYLSTTSRALFMKDPNLITSACRYCRHYHPEGRRGGMCAQLGVQVQAHWESCAFALPPFVTTWEKLNDIVLLETSLSLPETETIQPTAQETESKSAVA
jgi:hypothetical protein